jgi:tetratricopeptide (TPR) repeat protein
MRMLRDLLARERLGPLDRRIALRALQEPWCWPPDGELVAAFLRRHGISKVRPIPSLGSTCLLAVSPGESRATLHSFSPGRTDAPVQLPLRGAALEALGLARRVALRDLQLVGRSVTVPPVGDWFAEPVIRVGDGADQVLDGESYGLSMCLAVASLVLGRPVPVEVSASAEIDVEGHLHRVGGLGAKLHLLANAALGVTRLLVAHGQEQEARGILEALGESRIEVTGVRTVAEAFATTWQDLDAACLWENAEQAATGARALFRMALEGRSELVRWNGVAAGARQALERLPVDAELARFQANVARDIARRHDGESAQLAWPDATVLARLPRPRRLAYLAHVVQSATDSSDETTAEYLQHLTASTLVAPAGERHADDLKVLGARGRALAAMGRYPEAIDQLQEVLAEWFALDEQDQASHALCEYLRVLGVQAALADGHLDRAQARRHLQQAVVRWVEPVLDDPRTHEVSMGFLHEAAGRALVQCELHEEALDWLGDGPGFDWGLMYEHLRRSRARWLARALREVGRVEEADAALTALATTEDEYSWLARLDAALCVFDDPTPAAAGLLAWARNAERFGTEVHRVAQRLKIDAAVRVPDGAARRLAEEYRY